MVSMIIVYWPQVLALLIHRSTIFLPKAFFMRKTMFYLLLMGVVSGMPMLLTAQTITGAVKNSITGEPVPSVSVIVKGSKEGLRTDEKGNFNIHIRSFPATLVFSSISFESQEVKVAGENNNITVQLVPQSFMINEVVIGVIRVRSRQMDAAVSSEKVTARQIVNSPASSYYDHALSLKGVDVTTSSYTYKTISTRGFNGSGSARVNQLVDGMDNQAPGLNFFVGNFVGLTELDVESMELLPGASSALYGPGGMNGTVLINSKDPFKFPGLSILAKTGIMHVDKRQRAGMKPFHDYSFRWAQVIKDRFAFKVGAQYISATDWLASDSSNYARNGYIGKVIPGNRQTDPNYDGVNVYGDETSVDIYPFLVAFGDPAPEHLLVSRTGYQEADVIDPETKNIKLSGDFRYRINSKLEAQLMGYWATGNTVYTGNNRYALKGINIGQYKAELKHRDWFLRTYTTQEDAGEAYSATVASQFLNEGWKRSYDPANPAQSWYPQFTGAYLQARMAGAPKPVALNMARGYADIGRPEPGSAMFNQIFEQVRKTPIPQGGLFQEKSQLWMSEAQYNFSNKIKFADVIVGANWKKYILDSKGTLFIDSAQPITINEVGAYVQVSKKFIDEKLVLSLSGRYDKNEDFKGHFTPRVTALIKMAENNNVRLSYQTAYRFPTTQQKYIRLFVGDITLLGGLPWVMDFMTNESGPVVEVVDGTPGSTPYKYNELKPENSRAFEIGYKGLIKAKLLIDAYAYAGSYNNFLGRNILLQPSNGQLYSTVVNSATKVKTHGFGIGMDYQLHRNYNVFANVYSDRITDVPAGFQAYFNTPKYRMNAGFSGMGIGKGKNAGFNVVVRWQDGFMWDGELANGPVDAFATIDAQVNYKFKSINTTLKIGGTNITNHYYKNAYANPEIGGLYYVSVGYNLGN
jgi:outer membrane receptor protein involved in Fe transport